VDHGVGDGLAHGDGRVGGPLLAGDAGDARRVRAMPLHKGVGALDEFGHRAGDLGLILKIAGPVRLEAGAADDHVWEKALRLAAKKEDGGHRGLALRRAQAELVQ